MLFPRRKQRSRNGASLIESALAALILIPIALAVVDLMCIVAANSMNDTACKNAARAGANQPTGPLAQKAADKALATFQTSGIVKSIVIDDYNYTGEKGTFSIVTTMVVNPPVPFPGLSNLTFKARAVEPVVGAANPNPPVP